jgi:dolichol-phosphate mannosyltransferase
MLQIPAFEEHSFAAKRNDYCAAVFVFNEKGRLELELQRLKPFADRVDIIIADGGSTDGCVAEEILKTHGVNALLVKTGPGRLGSQMRMAFAWALERGYRGVVVVDGNNKDGVEAIPSFIEKLEEGYDHVQGSRFIAGGYHENTPLSRLMAVKFLHAPLMRMASGFHYTDTTNGFRAYSRAFLSDARVAVFRDIFRGYELHYYLAIRAARLGFRCIEIPVSRVYPAKGKIPTKISPLRGNLKVLAVLGKAICGFYNPRGS